MRVTSLRAIMVWIVLALGLIVGGCGGAAGQPPAQGTAAKSSGPEATKPAAAAQQAPAGQPAASGQVIQLRLQNHEQQNAANSQAFQRWADQVGQKTNGKVKITVYHAETLGKGMDAYPMVLNGIADLAWVVVPFFPGQFPLTEVSSLPMIGVTSSKVGGAAMADLYQQNAQMQKEWSSVHVITLFTSGEYHLGTKKQVAKLDDVKGLRIRAAGWGMTEMLKRGGANPITMAPAELYDSLSKGVIDGVIGDWQIMQANRLQEVLNYATNMAVGAAPQAFIMNKQKWESLPPDVQQVINEMSGKWASQFLGEAFDSVGPTFKENFTKANKQITEISPQEQAAWLEAIKPVWNDWVAMVNSKGLDGKTALEQMQAALAKNKGS